MNAVLLLARAAVLASGAGASPVRPERVDPGLLAADADIVDVGGRITLQETGGADSLVVGFHAFPEKASAVGATVEHGKGSETRISFENDGTAVGCASLFSRLPPTVRTPAYPVRWASLTWACERSARC